MSDAIADLRKEYTLAGLRRTDLDADPLRQFRKWFEQAVAAGVLEANAMTLATVNAQGQPSTRIVLLKGVDERGFSFYTNYESRKGSELAANPRAALTFYWAALERQVCIRGSCGKLSRAEADEYFSIRPRGNQLGAWVSQQSHAIPNRDWLEQRLEEMEGRFANQPVPTPEYWGGFLLVPEALEFWQGRPSRLHDRFEYKKREAGWEINRLSP